jgi:molecular chaperone DnaK
MVSDAEAHGEEDSLKKETVEVRNRLDSLVYEVEKNLKENRDKIEEEDAKNIEDALEKGREAIKSSDKGEIESAIEEISKASHKLDEVLYQAAQSEAGTTEGDPTASGDPGESDDDVVDAEYTDTDTATDTDA